MKKSESQKLEILSPHNKKWSIEKCRVVWCLWIHWWRKKSEKKFTEKMEFPFGGIAWFLADFQLSGHFWTLPVEVFHIIKSDKSKKVSGYGLYKCIGEEKRVKKITEKWQVRAKYPLDRIFRIFDWLYVKIYDTQSKNSAFNGFLRVKLPYL